MSTSPDAGVATQASPWSRLSAIDRFCLVLTGALVVAFFILPWISEDGTDTTGINLLLSGSPPLSAELAAVLAGMRPALLLVPLAVLMAGSGWSRRSTGGQAGVGPGDLSRSPGRSASATSHSIGWKTRTRRCA